MSERKVLNKYFPADYDPSKIPKANRPRNRQFNIRTMVPCNMRCNTCGEYIYKGKKFNSRCEVAEGENYLGLRIMRFYVRCPKCVSEITFKTDPGNQDYILEHGASRNFEARDKAEKMAQQEADKEAAEAENNPMKLLENRTKQSQREMEAIEQLEDLREQSQKKSGLTTQMLLDMNVEYDKQLKKLQEEEDEQLVRSMFPVAGTIRRLDSDEDDTEPPLPKIARPDLASDMLVSQSDATTKKHPDRPASKKGKALMAGLVRRKVPAAKQAENGQGKEETPSNGQPTGITRAHGSRETGTVHEPGRRDVGESSTENQLALECLQSNDSVSAANSCAHRKTAQETSSAQVASTAPKTPDAQADADKHTPALGALGMLGNYSDSDSATSE